MNNLLPTPMSEVTPISTPGNNSTPTVTVYINNVGTLTTNRPEGFTNGASIDITSSGNHNVTFASLPYGSYSDVKLTITYPNTSYEELILTTFEIITTLPTIIAPSQSGRNGFLSKKSVSLNGILYSKNASPFKTNTVPQGSDFSLNRFQFRKNVSTASKGIDASTRTQMLRIKAQKPSSIATNVAQSYKNVKTTYKDARFALSRVRR